VVEEERKEEDGEERMKCLQPLVLDDQSLSLAVHVKKNIAMSRRRLREALRGNGRLVAVVALPFTCQNAVLRAAQKVQSYCQSHHLARNIEVVIRVDFSPSARQVIPGWKGLMADPHKNGTYDVLHGTNLTRCLLTNLISQGMAVGTESVDIISPQLMSDLICWSSIRSCSTESQIHRELASGLPCPVGFSTSASNLQIAMDAVKAASHPHTYLGVDPNGYAKIVSAPGNTCCNVLLQGTEKDLTCCNLEKISSTLTKAGISGNLTVDCLPVVCDEKTYNHLNDQIHLSNQIASCIKSGNTQITGVILHASVHEEVLRRSLQLEMPADMLIDVTPVCQMLSMMNEAKNDSVKSLTQAQSESHL
jgi:3-deoxy-7-phosphoheptulonate synthase